MVQPSTAAVAVTGPGRFEITATDATAAQSVAVLAEEAWRVLAAPLRLPAAFPSPVFVRLARVSEWQEPAAFRTIVEAGGVVTLRMGWGDNISLGIVRRGLVQALLMRLAVAQHGLSETLTAPLWLEHGCVGWWETRADAAQLDRLKYESADLNPVAFASLLAWQRGEPEPRAWSISATWLLAHLQAEANTEGDWRGALRRLLAGDDPSAAIAAAFPGRFGDTRERELWWQTSFHHLRRARTMPTLDAVQSRGEIEALIRFVSGDDQRDAIVPLRVALEHAGEAFVRAELERRASEANRLLPSLHPFYRNAGVSLLEALNVRGGSNRRRADACDAFERDWRDALELHAAATSALDAMEKKRQ